jgi:integrase
MVRWASEQELLPPLRLPRSLRDMRGAPPFRRTFTRQELTLLLGAARPQMRACILLGVNVGFGNTDCANLTKRHICGAVIDQPRSKTGMPRRAFLWPETLEALNKSGLPFSNRRGGRLVTPNNDYIGSEFRALLKHVGIHGGRRGFYSLRRTFRTVVDSHWDHRAIDMIMGHATPGMGTRYVAWIDDDRLESVAMHAKQWMHGPVRTECRPDRDADSQQRRGAGHPQSSV